jgi:hypothetical protein
MSESRLERWGAASGLLGLAFGGAGGLLERGWPGAVMIRRSGSAPEARARA